MHMGRCPGALPSAGGCITLACFGELACWSQLGSAHDAFTYQLTEDGEQTIEGVVSVFIILNPHRTLIVDACAQAGSTEGWLLELSSAPALSALEAEFPGPMGFVLP